MSGYIRGCAHICYGYPIDFRCDSVDLVLVAAANDIWLFNVVLRVVGWDAILYVINSCENLVTVDVTPECKVLRPTECGSLKKESMFSSVRSEESFFLAYSFNI